MRSHWERAIFIILPLLGFAGLVTVLSSPGAAATTLNCTAVDDISWAECEALVALYNATAGDNWFNNDDWLETTTPCNWYGVACWNGHLAGLSLDENGLGGDLPPEMGNLTRLRVLSLERNQLSGLPDEIGNLTSLEYLHLHDNPLDGSLSLSLSNLSALQAVTFYNTGICVPAALETWLDNIDNVSGTGLRCGQQPGIITGTVAGPEGAPLSGVSVLLYRDDLDEFDVPSGGATTTAEGSYYLGGLGEGISYVLYFIHHSGNYLPHYYGGVPWSFSSATRITVSLGTTRTADVTLGNAWAAGTTMTSTTGTVVDDPFGTIYYHVPIGRQSDLTVTRVVTCAGGVVPDSVRLSLDMGTAGGIIDYLMSAPSDNRYQATIPAADITASGLLHVYATCDGVEQEPGTAIGAVNLYEPFGVIRDRLTGEAVPGATIALYYVPGWWARSSPLDTHPHTCESTQSKDPAEPWGQPAPTGEGVLVNLDRAEPYPYVSRVPADSQGRFGWTMLAGSYPVGRCWYVTVTADGYEPFVGPVVADLPAVRDLDLRLARTADPAHLPLSISHDGDTTYLSWSPPTTDPPPGYNIYRDAGPYSPSLITAYSSTTGTTWSDPGGNSGPWFYTVAGSDFTVVSRRVGVFPFRIIPGS